MNKVQLPASDVKITPLTFGAWAIGGWFWGGARNEKQVLENIKANDVRLTENDKNQIAFGLNHLQLEL